MDLVRIRSIKPELPSDKTLAAVSRDARLTFVYLVTQADDFGLVAGAPRQLLGMLYPHDNDVTIARLERWINELALARRVQWRVTRDGMPVVQLTNWDRHQRIDNRGRSTLLESLAESRGESRNLAEVRGEIMPRVGVGVGEGVGEGPVAANRREIEEKEFVAFWDAYPKRAGHSRHKALKVYRVRRKEGVSAEALLAGVLAYAAACQRDHREPRFIMHATTFLGDRREWESDWGAPEPETIPTYDERGEMSSEMAGLLGRK